MTQHIDVYTTDSTITLPSDLVSANLAVTAIGAGYAPTAQGAFVSGQIQASAFPLTVYVGSRALTNDGGDGYSGGGGSTGGTGGGGSTAVLSGSTLLIEAGGQDGVEAGLTNGTGGGYASNTPVTGAFSAGGAGSGGSQGGNGGASGSSTGGTGVGGGTNGNDSSGATSGAGVGSGGLPVPGCAASFAASSVIGYQYGQGPQNSGSGPGVVTVTYDVADAPSAPTLVSPAASIYADTDADGITLVGSYVTPGSDTGSLIAVAVSLKVDGGTVGYWDGTDFSSPTAVYVTPDTGVGATNGEQFSIVIPAGVLADGHTYTWGLSCQESFANLDGAFSATRDLIGAVAPHVTIDAPFPVLDGVETTLTPTISWTPTTPAGSQVTYQVKLFTAPVADVTDAVALINSGLITSASTSWTVTSDLNSIETYYGYLQITETGGQPSEWTPFVFTVQLNDPTVPTLTGSLSNEPTSGCPAPQLSANIGSGGTADPSVQFQASYDGGTTWSDLLGLAPGVTPAVTVVVPVSSVAEVYDMGAPFNVALQYRARNVAVSGGETYVSDWSTVLDL